MIRPLGVTALAAAAVVAVLLLVSSDDEGYRLRVDLGNAQGLREGSLVERGGVPVGKVVELRLNRRDRAEALIELGGGERPVARGARIDIRAKNLLGEKALQVRGGDPHSAEPAGTLIPGSRVGESVDLDQVLDVLDTDTRLKLRILLNEAGRGVADRRREFSTVLEELPPSVSDIRDLAGAVAADNVTLGRLIERSDRFIATFAGSRERISGLIATTGETAATFADRQAELRATLDRAPGTLAALRRLLAELRETTGPLGLAARSIAATAPGLSRTLAEVDPFERAARPVLATAAGVADDLTTLGRRATPVIREAVPTLSSLATFSGQLAPVARTIDLTSEDLLAILQGWSRAIQARDGISHMFRANVKVNADSARTAILRFQRAMESPAASRRRAGARGAGSGTRSPTHAKRGAEATPSQPSAPSSDPSPPPAPSTPEQTSQLLDFLLGP